MKKIIVFTDSEGEKYSAIRNCFSSYFKIPDYHVQVSVLDVKQKPETPFTIEGLYTTCEIRLDAIFAEAKIVEDATAFVACIQKGYYFMHGRWYLGGVVGIKKHGKTSIIASMVSIQLPQSISVALSKDINSKDEAIKKEFPHWNKKEVSVFKLLTGDDEINPFMETLRRNIKRFPLF